jgi:hypothetical protein
MSASSFFDTSLSLSLIGESTPAVYTSTIFGRLSLGTAFLLSDRSGLTSSRFLLRVCGLGFVAGAGFAMLESVLRGFPLACECCCWGFTVTSWGRLDMMLKELSRSLFSLFGSSC